MAWTLANELPRLALTDGLALLLLARDCDPSRYVLAAPRWHARLCTEAKLSLEESQLAISALNGLRGVYPSVAGHALAANFQLHGLDRENAALERWMAELERPAGGRVAD